MATIEVVDIQNNRSGSLELLPMVFEAKVRPHLYHAEVRRQLGLRRAGTHSTKNRALVSGGGAKPYRQKGTGRARQGSTRSPQFAGGGVVFGPVPRGYGHKLPKKVRRAALTSALTERFQASAVKVVEGIELADYKTKRMAEILETLGLGQRSVLIVLEEANPIVEASARNLPGVGVVRVEGLNVYDLLRHEMVLMTKPAVARLQARFEGATGREGEAG